MNRELVKRVRDWVKAGGDDQMTWEQSLWYSTKETLPQLDCGTACCVAGFAVANDSRFTLEKVVDGWGGSDFRVVDEHGGSFSFVAAGATALGLTPRQAFALFYSPAGYTLALLDALLADKNADLNKILDDLYEKA